MGQSMGSDDTTVTIQQAEVKQHYCSYGQERRSFEK
jgi:hypothetical protein